MPVKLTFHGFAAPSSYDATGSSQHITCGYFLTVPSGAVLCNGHSQRVTTITIVVFY